MAKKVPLTAAQKAAKAEARRQKAQGQAATNVFGKNNMQAGNWVAEHFIPEGSLGRLEQNPQLQARQLEQARQISTGIQTNPDGSPMMDAQGNPVRIGENQDVLNRYKDLAKGMTAEQYQAAREQQQKGLNSSLATSQAQLAKAQARGKVYGAAGAAQQANMLASADATRADLEQQNKLADINLIREGTSQYANSLAGMQAAERAGQQYNAERKTDTDKYNIENQRDTEKYNIEGNQKVGEFNLGQIAAERAAQIGGFFNTVGMGQENTLANKELDLKRKALAAATGTGRRGSGGGAPVVKEPEVTGGKTPAPKINTTQQYSRSGSRSSKALAKQLAKSQR